MNYAQSIVDRIATLPPEKQVEILDFVEFIAARHREASEHVLEPGEWTDSTFSELTMHQALRGIEHEPFNYTSLDLKERWL